MLLLLMLTIVFPSEGVKINDDISLNFPGFKEWFSGEDKPLPDSAIVDIMQTDTEDDSDSSFSDQSVDSAFVGDKYVYFKPHTISVDSARQPIELPSGSLSCLSDFFNSLCSAEDLKSGIRILHYGDSQIETDRITGYLRTRMQKQFGGCGAGLQPAKPAYDYNTPYRITASSSWKRYTIFPKRDTAIKHWRYGLLASFAMFSPPEVPVVQADTLIGDQVKDYFKPADKVFDGSVSFTSSTVSSASSRNFSRIRMYYGNTSKPFFVRVSDGETVLFNDSVAPSSYYSVKTWNFSNTPSNLKFDFSGTQSPEIYFFAMDGHGGISVDNVALRGCSGTIFTQMNAKFFADMTSSLKVKLIILQFGGNTVPYIKPGEVGGFKSSFAAQVRMIKKNCPGVSIIIIGPADMSTKSGDTYTTYPVLPEVVDALRSVAMANDCGYWDMYHAMGGENSMPQWVFHEPSLAEKDFVHFTPQGANIMAKMFYSALMTRYNEFISSRH